MKYNLFTFKNDKLLCWRLGSANSQKQKHFNRNVPSLAGQGTHKPPISRGIWAFPYPHYDFFFCYHQWEKHLPKKYLDDSIIKTEEDWIEKERLIKEIQKKFKPIIFYTGEFYSHIFPSGNTDYNDWFYWDNVRAWTKVARKTLFTYVRGNNNEIFKIDYSKDHLEIFIP